MSNEAEQPRRRGRPPRISREQIIDVAKTIEPTALTMRAIAAQLGVDPSAVNYHVTDREGLLELVAAEIVLAEIEDAELPPEADWRSALRIFADRLRAGVIRSGSHSPYFRFPAGGAARALTIVEVLLDRLTAAGMSTEEAIRAITAINQITFAAAREAVITKNGRRHPQRDEMDRVMRELAPDELPGARVVIEHWAPDSDEQFAYDIDVVIDGLEARLARSWPSGSAG